MNIDNQKKLEKQRSSSSCSLTSLNVDLSRHSLGKGFETLRRGSQLLQLSHVGASAVYPQQSHFQIEASEDF